MAPGRRLSPKLTHVNVIASSMSNSKTRPFRARLFACAADVALLSSCGGDRMTGLHIVSAGQPARHRAVSDLEAAWFALSGHWQQMTTDGLRLESHVYADTLTALADSAIALHYRGLALTSEAMIGTVVGSPGLIRAPRHSSPIGLALPAPPRGATTTRPSSSTPSSPSTAPPCWPWATRSAA